MKSYYRKNIDLYSRLAAYWKGEAPLSDADKKWFADQTDRMVEYYKKELQKELAKETGICNRCGGGCEE